MSPHPFSFLSRIMRKGVAVLCIGLFLCTSSEAFERRSLDIHRVDPLLEEWRWQRVRPLEVGEVTLAQVAPDGSFGFVRGPRQLWTYDGYDVKRIECLESVDTPEINAFAFTSAGHICVVTDDAVYLVAGDVWAQVARGGRESRAQNVISEDAQGILWIGLDTGIARIDPKAGSIDLTPTPSPVLSLCLAQSAGSVWAVLGPRGEVREYPLQKGHIAGEEQWILRGEPFRHQILSASLLAATDGRIWFINIHHNLPVVVFDPAAGERQTINLSRIGGDNLAFSILETPDGAIWISSRGTLHILRDGAWRVYHSPEFPLPGARSIMLHGPDGFVTIIEASGITVRVDYGKQQGLSFNGLHFQDTTADGDLLFISIDDEVVRWTPGADDAEFHAPALTGLSTPAALLVHSKGDWFLSGSHERAAAVSIFDGQSWQSHTFPDVGLSFGQLALLEGPGGEVWLGCAQLEAEFPGYGGGIVIFRPDEAGGYTVHRRAPPLATFRNWSLQAGPDGRIYTSGNDLFENLPGGALPIEVPEIVRYKWIDQVAIDAEGDVWCAVWSLGIFRLRNGEWTQFTEADGLGSNLTSFILCLDGRHPIASTSSGHYRFDGTRWAPYLGNLAGLHRGSGRLSEAADGSIWVNHTHVDWYYRGQREEPYAEEKRRNFRTMQYIPERAAPIARWVSPPSELFRNTDLRFHWKGLASWSRTPTDRLHYSYRMNGGAWSPFTADSELYLSEMEGGRHTIEVRARDADFNISPTPLRAEFSVIVPVWQQTWFIGALAFGVIFFVTVVVLFIRQRIRHLLEIENVKMRFFTHLSHEIKTPLTLILGPVERLQHEVTDGRHQHYLSLIKSNSQRLLFLVNQLLDFRKFQMNKLEYKPEEADFIPFARSCLSVFDGWIREKKHTFTFETNLAHFVFPFPHEIFHKIIDNLVNNAIKYTPEGGRITVRLHRKEAGGKVFGVLEVEDTGPGVAPSEQGAIFEPFYRSSSADNLAEGSGIGLAFVKELSESLSAQLNLTSPVNPSDREHPGSCFRVTFPVEREGVAAAMPAPTAAPVQTSARSTDSGEPPASTSARDPAGGLVLLVEDNRDLREFLADELRSFARVETAESAESGFNKAKELIPDIVFSDVIMAGRSGFDLCRDIKAEPHTSHIPVVLLTALRSDEHKRQAYESGADDFVPKPVSPEILRLKLRNILATQQHSRERVRHQFVDDNRITGLSTADQAFLDNVRAIVDAELSSEQFDVNALAEKMNFSRSAFYRKFNSLTDLSPAAFIRTTRLRLAAKWLAEGDKSVSEIAYDVGFSDAGYFSRVFKEEYKCPPSEFSRTQVGV